MTEEQEKKIAEAIIPIADDLHHGLDREALSAVGYEGRMLTRVAAWCQLIRYPAED